MFASLALVAGGLLLATSVHAERIALITSSGERNSHPECLHKAYHGTYGRPQFDLFLPTTSCFEASSASLNSASVAAFDQEHLLLWIQEAGVDNSIRGDEIPLDQFLDVLGRPATSLRKRDGQQYFNSNSRDFLNLVLRVEGSALVSIPTAALSMIDNLLPRLVVPTLIPSSALEYVKIPPHAITRVQNLLATLHFDPSIASLLSGLSLDQMYNDVHFLTGEDTASPIVSRHSFSEGARFAATWLKSRFEDMGAACELRSFTFGFSPNVICRYQGTANTTSRVILGAHYDSRGSFGSPRAPGGDDDGSGTTQLLAIARAIHRKRITFRANVELVAFAGEEQGLVGSRHYAKDLRDEDADVILMIQADMLAYHSPTEPPQLGLPDLIGLPEATQLVANVSAIYSPELTVGFTPACCSDHQSFHEQGFPSTQVFERAGPIIDPMYHNSGDLSSREGYDLEQLKSIAKVTFATLLHAAKYDLPKEE